jgi:hypothetical protein
MESRQTPAITATDERLLEGLIAQANQTTAQASAAIDRMLAIVEVSNRRIEAMETKRKQCTPRSS